MEYRNFTPEEHKTWETILIQHEKQRDRQIHSIFLEGIKKLGMTRDRIPNLNEINLKLRRFSGFEGVPVEGLEKDGSFYSMLADRKFPIGNFIRAPEDVSYTPAPDVIHDLYGHMPFFCDVEYGEFCENLGKLSRKYADNPDVIAQLARLFWFGIEFSLIDTPQGRRIFGAGIASSYAECDFALSDKPEIVAWDLEKVRRQEFKIDEFQKRLFCLSSPYQLYDCLDELEKLIKADNGKPLVTTPPLIDNRVGAR